MEFVRNLIRDTSGATAIEYSLIACLLAIVIVAALQTAGTGVSTVFGEVGNGLK
jgi:pilus assembly protein Flp/PilA